MPHKISLDPKQHNINEVQVSCGSLFIICGYDESERLRFFFEVSTDKGGCEANLQGLAKLLTIIYNDGRLVSNRERIIQELDEITCKGCMRWFGKILGEGKSIEGLPKSCPSAIAKVLKNLDFKEEKK
jgi:hypothetical protein